MCYVIFSDKIAQLKAQIRLQKEAEAKGEKLSNSLFTLVTIGCKCLPRSYRIPSVLRKSEDQLSANKFTGTQGPIRSTGHIAISNRFDYQPGNGLFFCSTCRNL